MVNMLIIVNFVLRLTNIKYIKEKKKTSCSVITPEYYSQYLPKSGQWDSSVYKHFLTSFSFSFKMSSRPHSLVMP